MTSTQRVPLPALADVPTLAESGLAGFSVTQWNGLYAPRATPQDVLDAINAALVRALADTDFLSTERARGSLVVTDYRSTPAGHQRFVQAEIERWAPLLSGR